MGYAIKPDGGWRMVTGAGAIGEGELYSELPPGERPNAWSVWTASGWTPNLTAAKTVKLAEIDAAYEAAMAGGFLSSALGAPHRYASSIAAQVKLAGAAISALAGDAVQYECTEVATGITAPRAHTISQMKQAMLDGKNRAVAYKLHQTDLHNQVAAIVVGGTTTEAIAIALVLAITPAFE